MRGYIEILDVWRWQTNFIESVIGSVISTLQPADPSKPWGPMVTSRSQIQWKQKHTKIIKRRYQSKASIMEPADICPSVLLNLKVVWIPAATTGGKFGALLLIGSLSPCGSATCMREPQDPPNVDPLSIPLTRLFHDR
jgi:hypothetical protein